MTTYRIHKSKDFSIVPNALINDAQISWEARAVMIYLLAKPDNWIPYMSDLLKNGPAGKDKLQAIFQELEGKYILRQKVRKPGGRFAYEVDIFDSRKTCQDHAEKHHSGKSAVVTSAAKPATVDQHRSTGAGSPDHLISTDLASTDLTRTDVARIDESASAAADADASAPLLSSSHSYYEKTFGKLAPEKEHELLQLEGEYGAAWVKTALENACRLRKNFPIAYARKACAGMRTDGRAQPYDRSAEEKAEKMMVWLSGER